MNDNLYSIEEEDNRSEYDIEDKNVSDTTDEYVLEDENNDSEFCEYVIEDEIESIEENDAEAWSGKTNEAKPSPFGLIFKILANPVHGWKNLKRCKYSVDSVASSTLYPLLAVAAVSEYTALFYDVDASITSLFIPAIITFITFFFGYFSVLLLSDFLLPKEARKTMHTYFGKEYVMINVSTLTLFYIIYRLFPLAAPIVAFLPLWTIYIACKGVKLFRLPAEKETRTCGMMSFLIIGCPLFWNWLFNEIMI